MAALVAAGQTNRQIASILFISEKTVESHLARMFAKLGVNGRPAQASFYGRSAEAELQSRR